MFVRICRSFSDDISDKNKDLVFRNRDLTKLGLGGSFRSNEDSQHRLNPSSFPEFPDQSMMCVVLH